MIGFNVFSSRKEKEKLLQNIIGNLKISPSEKDIYILCIEVLDDTGFEIFFKKIILQLGEDKTAPIQQSTIAPLTSNLI